MRRIDLSALPRRENGNPNHIDWNKSINHIINFTYDGINDSFIILKYISNSKRRYLIVLYRGFETELDLRAIHKLNLGKLKELYENGVVVTKEAWSQLDEEVIIENYHNKSIYELAILLPNRTLEAIQTKARRLGMKKSEERKYVSSLKNLKYTDEEIENHIIKNNSVKNSVEYGDDYFKGYKKILSGEHYYLDKINLPKHRIILLFKYYLKRNKINCNREYFANCIIGKILKEAKLKSAVMHNFNGYYDFITQCFPRYKFKEWEFKYLNVTDGFWRNRYNRLHCVRETVRKMVENGYIENELSALSLSREEMLTMFHSSLIAYYGRKCIFEYIKSTGVDMTNLNVKVYKGLIFDSYEELTVYKFIVENYNVKIEKGSILNKYTNTTIGENYVPDFIISEINSTTIDKKIVVEYFGMYKDDVYKSHFVEYKEKTHRKIKYYENNNDIQFVSLFPENLKNNFKGVEEKLKPLLGDSYFKGVK